MKKLYTLSQLSSIIQKDKAAGLSIVLANGCFDLIHVGHIRYLTESRQKGDKLVTALNSDKSVKKLKGIHRPILNEQERASILSSFACVDYVLIFEETTVTRILNVLKPHIHAKGSDYTVHTVPEKDAVHGYGGEIVITGGPKVKSTSELIKEIAEKVKTWTNTSS